MQILLKIFLVGWCLVLVACSTVSNLVGETHKTEKVAFNAQLSLEENVGEPLEGKHLEWLPETVKELSQKLTAIPDVRVFTLRNDQAVKLLIPASSLFAPNDSVLKPTVSEILSPVLLPVQSKEFNLIVAAYMDDSGTPEYTQKMTRLRAEATSRWFIQAGIDTASVITYAFGSEYPRRPNTSVQARAENRRIELFLLPSQALLDSHKRGFFRKR